MVVQGKARRICAAYESTLSTADAVPLPRWGRGRGVTLRVDFYKGRCPDARKWYSSHGLPVITTIRVGPWRRKSRRGTSEFGLIPKRRLACPLRRLPVRLNGPRRRRRMDPRSGVKNYVRLSVFHLSSRPKWRDLFCRPVNRG